MEKYRLTTEDNPFNPFTQWDEWLFYDSMTCGYNTCERIAMQAKTSDQLPEQTNNYIIEQVLDELVEVGACSKQGKIVKYIKVLNPNYKEPSSEED